MDIEQTLPVIVRRNGYGHPVDAVAKSGPLPVVLRSIDSISCRVGSAGVSDLDNAAAIGLSTARIGGFICNTPACLGIAGCKADKALLDTSRMFECMTVKVVIPVLNEAASIGKVLADIPDFVDEVLVARRYHLHGVLSRHKSEEKA